MPKKDFCTSPSQAMNLVFLWILALMISHLEMAQGFELSNFGWSAEDVYQNEFKQELLKQSNKIPERTVYVFLSSECPCSDSYLSEINRLSETFREVNFVGIHSNYQEDAQKAEAYFRNPQIKFPVIKDTSQKLLNVFKAYKTPHAYIVRNKDQRVLYHGGVGSERQAKQNMRHLLEEALKQGEAPNPSQTKSIGCVIERRET